MQRHWTIFAATLLLVFLSACAGSREAADLDEEPDELPVPAVNLAEYEDFDPSAYEDADLGPTGLLEHDVPTSLMEGRADEGIRTEVQGFRVQVHSSLDRNAAFDVEEDAREWLIAGGSPAPPGLSSGEPPIYVVYMQPYYRVRVGNYATRQAAERARQYLSERFPEAFIVPDSVTITR